MSVVGRLGLMRGYAPELGGELTMSPVQKRWILGGGALAAVAIVVVAAAVLLRGSSTPGAAPKGEGPGSSQSVVESPAKAATTYLKSFADNYAADAAVVTDDPAATTAASPRSARRSSRPRSKPP